ncbi:MAG: heat-inducible transcriptional repressor HrcA [Thermodesulfovibrionales bacterium]|nr:heat-inducible transcriptional repressor HrcA [Thermodesulfovibrionales bacterium]
MLDERAKKILMAVVESYIQRLDPVGSRHIAKKYGFDLSSATIRNVMADLEELGYLLQPHTSAGRIPTDKGFRFYVNNILSLEPKVDPVFIKKLTRILEDIRDNIDLLLERTAKSLADLTHYVSVASHPFEADTVIKKIEIKKVSGNQILFNYETTDGVHKKRIIDVNMPLTQSELNEAARYINSRFSGYSIKEIRGLIFSEMARDKIIADALISKAIRLCREALLSEDMLFIYGFSQVFELPDFFNIARIRELVRTIEDKYLILNLLNELIYKSNGMKVIIGSENQIKEMHDFSIVASTYYDQYRPAGAICLIGPKRMDYAKAISVVRTVADFITDVLSGRRRHG